LVGKDWPDAGYLMFNQEELGPTCTSIRHEITQHLVPGQNLVQFFWQAPRLPCWNKTPQLALEIQHIAN
jgi:hypothetical protein